MDDLTGFNFQPPADHDFIGLQIFSDFASFTNAMPEKSVVKQQQDQLIDPGDVFDFSTASESQYVPNQFDPDGGGANK